MSFQLFVGSSSDVPLQVRVHFDLTGDSGAFYYRDPWREYITGDHGGGLQLHSLARMDGAADLPCDDRLLGVQVSLNDSTRGDQHLRADSHRTLDATLDSDDPLCLQVADNCHVAGNNGEGNLVRLAALQLVSLLVASGAGEDAHQRPSLTNVMGSSDSPRWRISKWR